MKLVPWRKKEIERGGYTVPLPFSTYQGYFSYNNNLYPFGVNQTLRGDKEPIAPDFEGLSSMAYGSNAVVFACESLRMDVFSEVRFQFQELRGGRPGNLFGTPDLAILEDPDLSSRAIQDADLAGNWFGYLEPDRICRLRPDWVDIVLGSRLDADNPGLQWDTEVLGYLYHPGGLPTDSPEVFLKDEVAHFAPRKDPLARFRGMSWLTPVIREVQADSGATSHKAKFFENGATSNMVIKMPESVRKEAMETWVEKFRGSYEGLSNAYRTIVLGGGADVSVVGANFQQMDFKVTQGAGETRIAAAARTHPVLVGLSEGLQGASLNAGNFGLARRSFADGTMRPLWRNFAGSLQTIVPAPRQGTRLWYDARDVAFLREDEKDAAEIQQLNATAAKTLIDAGYDPASVTDAITADDFSRLNHTGLVSVQLQPPGPADPASNGNGTVPAELVQP